MSADLATLRALATSTRDAYAGTETDDNGGYTCAICSSDFHVDDECEPTNLCRSCAYDCADKCAAALLLACDEIAALRATLARMTTPTLTEFSAIATAALRDSSAAWNGMSDTEKAAIKARVRYGLDYLASAHGVDPGDIYAAGPGDPPPTSPPT